MNNHQNGSALFYILITVALFAALSFAVSSMMRGGGNIGNEKAGIYASEIMNYSRSLRDNVQALRISNTCEDTQLSFERMPFDGSDTAYVNANAPADFSCHVFHPDGGGMSPQTDFNGKNWIITGDFFVSDLGSAAPEISATLIVDRTTCEILNDRLDVSNNVINTQQDDGAQAGNILPAFQGSFGSGEILLPEYLGKPAGCYSSMNAASGEYTFYQTLVPR